MDYLLPTATEVPVIEYGHIETPSPGPGGYKGVGEGGAIGAPPCVVNAVADALAPFGVTVTRLPLTPSRIVALLDEAKGPKNAENREQLRFRRGRLLPRPGALPGSVPVLRVRALARTGVARAAPGRGAW